MKASMRIPNRFAPILFGALLSAIMVAIVSAVVLAINQGVHHGFVWQWLRSCVTTWPVAFPTVTRRSVGASSGWSADRLDSAL
jgi:hypothetical protein